MALETRYDGIIQGDLLDARTTDGILITDLWRDAENFRAAYNRKTNALLSFMGYQTTSPDADIVRQVRSQWQRGTEFGKPDSRIKVQIDYEVTTGLERFAAGLEWTDFAQLMGITGDIMTDAVGAIFAEDELLLYRQLWEQFFDKDSRTVVDIMKNKSVSQLPFYNGDSRVPPPVGNKSFSSPHNHYMRTASDGVITVADLDAEILNLTEHGFQRQVYIFGSQTTIDEILELGDPYIARIYLRNELIPTDAVNINQQGALLPGSVMANQLFEIVGVYKGRARLAYAQDMPEGYYGIFSHEGPMSPMNPLQVRLHQNPGLRGVMVNQDSHLPFAGRYYQRFRGIGTRQFGNGVAVQWDWSSGTSYQTPTWTYAAF